MKPLILWRLKSNHKTIAKPIYNEKEEIIFLQIVWAESWDYGIMDSFVFKYLPDNLEPLSNQEMEEILKKRELKGLLSI